VPQLAQPRAEAILAVLAECGDLGCTRQRLIGLLWPEKSESRARHNLRDALHVIRRALGKGSVTSRGDHLFLDPAVVTSDVRQFAQALEEGRLADAVAAYSGPLLDGFYLDDAPECERWVQDERARLLRECIEAVKRLAKKAEQEGRWDDAASSWARALYLDRYNTRFVVRRMVALARGGDRANAIKEAEEHCQLLKSQLDLDPDASLLEELERLRSGEGGPANFFTPGPFVPPPPPKTDQ
jgi:DNA-binding SARP family transcriptional activator